MKSPSSREKTLLLIFCLFLIIMGGYGASLYNDFVNIDDPDYVADNLYIRDLSWGGIAKIFTSRIVWNYFPLQILSYAFDFKLWQLNPFGYHLTNVFFHFLNSVLIFFLLKKLYSDNWLAFLTAVLFGIHPINVESVTWISERKNVLSLFFLLPSFMLYIRYQEESEPAKRKGMFLGSLLLFLLSLLAKSSAVIFPLLLILYDYCFGQKKKWEMIINKIPYFCLSLGIAVIQILLYRSDGPLDKFHGGSVYTNALATVKVIIEYVISLAAPFYLDNYYVTQVPKSFWEPQVVFSFLALILFIILGWFSFKKKGMFFFWSAWFLISLLPVLNIIPISILRADRYMYLPAIGFFFLVSKGLMRLRTLPPNFFFRPVFFLFAAMIIGGATYITIERNLVWKDSCLLWEDNLRKNPDHPFPYTTIGARYLGEGKTDLAMTYFQTGLKSFPDNVSLLNGLGLVYIEKEKWDEAESLLKKALQKDPTFRHAQVNLGTIYLRKEQMEMALQEFQQVIDAGGQGLADAYINRGIIYTKWKQPDKAIQDFQEAIRLSPATTSGHIGLALTYENMGMLDQALERLQKGLGFNPKSCEGHFHLGRLYLKKNNLRAGEHHLLTAFRLNPNHADTNYYLGLISKMAAQNYFERAEKTGSPELQKQVRLSLAAVQAMERRGR